MLEASIIINLSLIIYQDLRSQLVYWFLFPTLGLLLAYLHFSHSDWYNFIIAISLNIVLVFSITLILLIYSKFKIKRPFFKEVFGLGDLFFFLAIAVGFPSITFIVVFVLSIIFSLVTGILLIKKQTIPLAGFMSIFMMVLLATNWIFNTVNLYII